MKENGLLHGVIACVSTINCCPFDKQKKVTNTLRIKELTHNNKLQVPMFVLVAFLYIWSFF